MTYEEFSIEKLDEIPVVPLFEEDDNEYDSVVIIPMNYMHDSGYMCMTYLFCKGTEIICRSHGNSDVLHIDKIGGYRHYDYPNKTLPQFAPVGWKIDCLPNGYLRLFCNEKIINCDGISDWEICAKE